MELKQGVFEKLEDLCREDTIFCTNTSVMSPTQIGKKLKEKRRFVGTHFWNPAQLIPLVEIVKADGSSDETAQTVLHILEGVGKKPVICQKDVPGFIANRMEKMGPITQKLYDTLTGIQQGLIEAPKGWIKIIE